MRRNFNLRKRKPGKLNIIDVKNIILSIALFLGLIICIILIIYWNQSSASLEAFAKSNEEFYDLNSDIPFSINKMILFSSATANAKTINFSFGRLDISQFTDIGIYLNKLDSKSNKSIKSLYIDNISVENPNIGTAYLYKKNVENLGEPSFSEDLIITDKIDFNISKSDNVNNSNYEIASDASTPIAIGYYNKNVKEDSILYLDDINMNGTLLKDALIPLSDLASRVSFTINITTENDEQYLCNISFDIPLENEEESIYDEGYITKQINEKNISKFIRIK